jgi:hypothetical protein
MDRRDYHFGLRALRVAAQQTAQPAQAPAVTRMPVRLAVPKIVNSSTKVIIHDFNAVLAKMAPHSGVRTPSVGSTRMEW